MDGRGCCLCAIVFLQLQKVPSRCFVLSRQPGQNLISETSCHWLGGSGSSTQNSLDVSCLRQTLKTRDDLRELLVSAWQRRDSRDPSTCALAASHAVARRSG